MAEHDIADRRPGAHDCHEARLMGASRMSRMRSASTSARGSGSASDGCDSSPDDKEFWTIFGTLSEEPSKSKTEPGDRSSGKLLARGSKPGLIRRSPLRNCDARTT